MTLMKRSEWRPFKRSASVAPMIDPFLVEIWHHPRSEPLRASTFQGFLDSQNARVLPIITEAFAREDVSGRQHIMTGLRGWGEQAVPLWCQGLADEEIGVRTRALAELHGILSLEKMMPLSLQTLWVDAVARLVKRETRTTDLKLLGLGALCYGGPAAFPTLAEAFEARDGVTEPVVIVALGMIKDDRALPLLAKTLPIATADAGRIILSTLPYFGERAIPIYLAGLHHSLKTVWMVCCARLGELKAHQAVAPLSTIVSDHPQQDLRILAIRALAEIQDADALPALRAATKDPDPSIRQEALQAMENFGEMGDDLFKKRP